MSKTIEDYFADWEAHVFGFGYGSGEIHTLSALRTFLMLCDDDNGSYDFREAEKALGPVAAWLTINVLCHADIIEYGTSTRFGFLNPHGQRLRSFVRTKNTEELCDATERDLEYHHCFPDFCNCMPESACENPFWGADSPYAMKA